MEVSIIMIVYNAELEIDQCMKSISDQTVLDGDIEMEIIAFNNGSTDSTKELLKSWQDFFLLRDVNFINLESPYIIEEGVAKNEAIKSSTGVYICFQRCGDIMLPDRIELQLNCAQSNHNAIIGSRVVGNPEQPSSKLAKWANELEEVSIKAQIYTSNGPTLLVATWFFARFIYDKIAGFEESELKGFEYRLSDMIFFYTHLENGGNLVRLEQELIIFTYCESFIMTPETKEKLWQFRLSRMEKYVLPQWEYFNIWNTRMARRFVRYLTENGRKRVKGFCDLDDNNIGKKVDLYCPKKKASVIRLSITNFLNVKPLIIVCNSVKSNRAVEKHLKCIKLVEGIHFVVFD